MNWLNSLMLQIQHYWHFPGYRLGLGIALFAFGIIYLNLPDSKPAVGLTLTIIGLGILLEAVSVWVGVGQKVRPEPPPAVQEPKNPGSFMRIQVAPKPAGGS